MRFYATSCKGTVITDDYDNDEVKKGLHIKNILHDYKNNFDDNFLIKIYDENDTLIKQVFLRGYPRKG